MEIAIPEPELQQEIQRFATRFVDRITQASEVLQGSSQVGVRDEALRKGLLYASSALEIATGPAAAVDLLDMFVFVRLCRSVLDRHWIPVLYGNDGAELSKAFATSDEEITQLVERTLTSDVRAQLEDIIETWRAANPRQVRVEGMRLSDFSTVAGNAAAGRAVQASGLLSSMKTASHVANEAMRVAERGIFLAQRLPSLWRLQVRLGVREVLADTKTTALPSVATLARVAKRSAVVAIALIGAIGLMRWTRDR